MHHLSRGMCLLFFCGGCYDLSFPSDAALPDELKDENPLGIWRTVDGTMIADPS